MKINTRQSLLFLFFCTGLFAFTTFGLVSTGARAPGRLARRFNEPIHCRDCGARPLRALSPLHAAAAINCGRRSLKSN